MRQITQANVWSHWTGDSYFGKAYDGDNEVVSVMGSWRWSTTRKLARAIKLYVKHGITSHD